MSESTDLAKKIQDRMNRGDPRLPGPILELLGQSAVLLGRGGAGREIPREPTEEMLAAGAEWTEPGEIWAAMYDAAPKEEEEPAPATDDSSASAPAQPAA